MKNTILILATLVLSQQASASWYQEYCSNAEGTTKWSNGHNDNALTYTTRDYKVDGGKNEVIEADQEQVNVEIADEKKLREQAQSSCSASSEGGRRRGFYSKTQVTYRRVVLTNKDGSLFSENALGVSRDRKSIQADLICEFNLTSETMCK